MGVKSTINMTRDQVIKRIQETVDNIDCATSAQELEEIMNTELMQFSEYHNYSIVEEGQEDDLDEYNL